MFLVDVLVYFCLNHRFSCLTTNFWKMLKGHSHSSVSTSVCAPFLSFLAPKLAKDVIAGLNLEARPGQMFSEV